MTEPTLLHCGIRDSADEFGFPMLDIECRFSDGQKYAAIVIDGEFPQLAEDIRDFLNSRGKEN
jgi:hypothetical protein